MGEFLANKTKVMLFVIGACEKHKVRIAGELTGRGQETFHKQLVEGYCPQKEEFIFILQYLINDGFVIVDDLDDVQKQQEMWKWYLKHLGENNEAS